MRGRELESPSCVLRMKNSPESTGFFMLQILLSQERHNLSKGQVSLCEKLEGLGLGYFYRKSHVSPGRKKHP